MDVEPPFRWDLVRPDQLGSLVEGLDDIPAPFPDELAKAAGKVLARSADSDLVFVGRSLDSMFDLLGGALAELPDRPVVSRLPLSFARDWVEGGQRTLTKAEVETARELMSSVGSDPAALAGGGRRIVFVDVVARGATFGELFELLRAWVEESRQPWNVVRRRISFLGITGRGKTTPNAYRWYQHQDWVRDLPARSASSISMDWVPWSYFANDQVKLHRSFQPHRWTADPDPRDRTDRTRKALAEAVATVWYGRSVEGRRAVARAIDGAPALAEAWLRTLQSHLLA